MTHTAQDETRVSREFWPKLKRVARSIPFAEDAIAAYYCALDRETPTHVRATLIGALAYFVLPFDMAPDFLPLVGFADDASVLAAAIASVRLHMTDRHRDAARRTLAEEGIADPS
ncbi:YkvA family protein [Methylopila turkensis]|uniref:DUF1232 domain-containing protein n=1 Tax=Methylopila turkensis TaxID=1437816 RepID=A0A9W6JP83_9HYPH|nr:YkvA family protein [Methylopila turkensis]GLK79490.1 hypothetical protein GCM10008174_12310 [Methylopila turkensis]